MYGLVVRVEMIYMLIYFYIICKYFFESRLGLFLCDKYYLLFLIISFAIVVVLLFIYLIVGFYNYKRINEIGYYQELRKKILA